MFLPLGWFSLGTGYCAASVSLLTFTELSLHMDVLALIWLKHILALLRYCTCKEGLSVCCWCLPHRALSLFLPLLPSGLWLSLSYFRRWVSKLCVKAQHLLPLPVSFFALLFGLGLSLLRAARGWSSVLRHSTSFLADLSSFFSPHCVKAQRHCLVVSLALVDCLTVLRHSGFVLLGLILGIDFCFPRS